MFVLRSKSISVSEVEKGHGKKYLFKVVFLLVFMLGLYTPPAQAKYGGGTGEPNDPYLIYTAEQLNTIGTEPNDLDKHFRLMADIDLGIYTAGEFNVIGEYWLEPFIGVFDGNNHTISNFTYSPTRMPFINGLFGQVGSFEFQANAVIKDLGLIDPNIDAGTGGWVGSLAGLFVGGTITNCYVQGGNVSGDQDVGGLVGGAALMLNSSVRPDELSNSADYQQPEIFNCYTTCDVSGNENVGGLLGGGNLHLKISRCYSTGSISGDKWIGGLVGRHNGNISTCYSTASVLGNEDVGGLVGRKVSGKIYGCYSTGCVSGDRCIGGLVGRNTGIIEDCYSAGYVSGTTNVGGLLGSSTRNSVYTSFWDFETSGQLESAGGVSKNTNEMKQKATYVDWDFIEVWDIAENQTYPFLRWCPPGDINGDCKVDIDDLMILMDHWLQDYTLQD